MDQRGCPVAINTRLSITVHDGESTTDDGRESAIDEDATSMFLVFSSKFIQQSSIITHVMYSFHFRMALSNFNTFQLALCY